MHFHFLLINLLNSTVQSSKSARCLIHCTPTAAHPSPVCFRHQDGEGGIRRDLCFLAISVGAVAGAACDARGARGAAWGRQ